MPPDLQPAPSKLPVLAYTTTTPAGSKQAVVDLWGGGGPGPTRRATGLA